MKGEFVSHIKNMKRVYISGPISKIEDKNRDSFYYAEITLASFGFIPINPHRIAAHLPDKAPWLEFMRVDISEMMSQRADALYMLRGWFWSRGARIEWILGKLLGLEIIYE